MKKNLYSFKRGIVGKVLALLVAVTFSASLFSCSDNVVENTLAQQGVDVAKLTVDVRDAIDGVLLSGAKVYLDGGAEVQTTPTNGRVVFDDVRVGTHNIRVVMETSATAEDGSVSTTKTFASYTQDVEIGADGGENQRLIAMDNSVIVSLYPLGAKLEGTLTYLDESVSPNVEKIVPDAVASVRLLIDEGTNIEDREFIVPVVGGKYSFANLPAIPALRYTLTALPTTIGKTTDEAGNVTNPGIMYDVIVLDNANSLVVGQSVVLQKKTYTELANPFKYVGGTNLTTTLTGAITLQFNEAIDPTKIATIPFAITNNEIVVTYSGDKAIITPTIIKAAVPSPDGGVTPAIPAQYASWNGNSLNLTITNANLYSVSNKNLDATSPTNITVAVKGADLSAMTPAAQATLDGNGLTQYFAMGSDVDGIYLSWDRLKDANGKLIAGVDYKVFIKDMDSEALTEVFVTPGFGQGRTSIDVNDTKAWVTINNVNLQKTDANGKDVPAPRTFYVQASNASSVSKLSNPVVVGTTPMMSSTSSVNNDWRTYLTKGMSLSGSSNYISTVTSASLGADAAFAVNTSLSGSLQSSSADTVSFFITFTEPMDVTTPLNYAWSDPKGKGVNPATDVQPAATAIAGLVGRVNIMTEWKNSAGWANDTTLKVTMIVGATPEGLPTPGTAVDGDQFITGDPITETVYSIKDWNWTISGLRSANASAGVNNFVCQFDGVNAEDAKGVNHTIFKNPLTFRLFVGNNPSYEPVAL